MELQKGPRRFNELVNSLRPSVVRRTLARRLKELENAGLITREITAERPPAATYKLTEKGIERIKLIVELEK